jgi:hypothetical protein
LNISNLLPIKKGDEILHLYLKGLIRFLKNIGNLKFQFFDEITVQDFPIRGHQVYLHILAEDGSMKTLGKSSIEIGFSSRRNSGNRSSRLLKRSIDSHPNDCNAIASFYGVTGKNYKINTRIF